MQLNLIQTAVAGFRRYLQGAPDDRYLPLYETQLNWQREWKITAEEVGMNYDFALQNTQTRRYWKADNYAPKKMILLFAEAYPDLIREMFRDLFNEDRDVGGRIGRFLHHCDELLREYKAANPRSVENNHFHDDNYRIISLYLACRYPAQYAPLDFVAFTRTLEAVNTRNPPTLQDLDRIFKIHRALYKWIQKDEALMVAHRARLDPALHYTEDSLVLVLEFCRWVAGRPLLRGEI